MRTAYRDEQEFTFNDEAGVVVEGKTTIAKGQVTCNQFPLMILTSNGERDFPPPFLRRCVRLTMQEPDEQRLTDIVKAHLRQEENGEDLIAASEEKIAALVRRFLDKRSHYSKGDLATDQLLNAIYLITRERRPNLPPDVSTPGDLIDRLWKHLSSSEDQQSDNRRRG